MSSSQFGGYPSQLVPIPVNDGVLVHLCVSTARGINTYTHLFKKEEYTRYIVLHLTFFTLNMS